MFRKWTSMQPRRATQSSMGWRGRVPLASTLIPGKKRHWANAPFDRQSKLDTQEGIPFPTVRRSANTADCGRSCEPCPWNEIEALAHEQYTQANNNVPRRPQDAAEQRTIPLFRLHDFNFDQFSIADHGTLPRSQPQRRISSDAKPLWSRLSRRALRRGAPIPCVPTRSVGTRWCYPTAVSATPPAGRWLPWWRG